MYVFFLYLVKHSGVIIDTPSRLIEKDGLELLEGAIQDFEVNIIIVIGNERLLIDLQRKYSQDSSISIVKLNKSGGVFSCSYSSRSYPEIKHREDMPSFRELRNIFMVPSRTILHLFLKQFLLVM